MNWSSKVKNKDGNRCRNCHGKENLQAHHLYSQAIYPDLKEFIPNGITLCGKCHKDLHKWLAGSSANPEIFLEWYQKQIAIGKGKTKYQTITNMIGCLQRNQNVKQLLAKKIEITKKEDKMDVLSSEGSNNNLDKEEKIPQFSSFDQYLKQLPEIKLTLLPETHKQLLVRCRNLNITPKEFIFHLITFELSRH